MDVSRVLIREKQLFVKIENINENEELSFVLQNQETKDVFYVDAHPDIQNQQVILDYEQICLQKVEQVNYEVFLSTKEEGLIRLKNKKRTFGLNLNRREVFYHTDEQYGFRFYFTKDNEVSLLRGNYLNVESKFKRQRKIDIPVDSFTFFNDKLALNTSLESKGDNIYVAWKEKKNKYILHTGAYFQIDGNRATIEINRGALPLIIELKNATPIVAFIRGNILYEGRLTTDLTTSSSQIGNKLGIYCYSNHGKFRITSNLESYLEKVLSVPKEACVVEKHSFSPELLSVDLLEQIEQTENVFIFKENIDNKYFESVGNFTISDSRIEISDNVLESTDQHYRYVLVEKTNAQNNADNLQMFDETENDSVTVSTDYRYFGFYNKEYNDEDPKKKSPNESIKIGDDSYLLAYWNVDSELIFKTVTLEKYQQILYDEAEIEIPGVYFKEGIGIIEVELESIILDSESEVNFYLRERKTKQKVAIDFRIKGPKTVVLDFRSFISEQELISTRWDVLVELRQQGKESHGKLGLFSSEVKGKFDRYLSPISQKQPDNKFRLVPYFSSKNELCLTWNDSDNIHNERLEHDIKITNYKVTKKNIMVEAMLSNIGVSNFRVVPGKIKLRNKSMVVEHEIPAKVVSETDEGFAVQLNIDPHKFHFLPFYWDIYVILQVGEEKFPFRLKNPTRHLKRSVKKRITRNEIDLADHYMIYPYITADKSFALTYRERMPYENRRNRFKENLAYVVYRLFQRQLEKKKIWIGYEKNASVAQDNGYQFFNYCYNNNKKDNYYFVIKRDSPDYEDIKHQSDKILKFMSFKYMLYMFGAELMISSESKGHSYDIRIQKGRLHNILNRKKFIFLQHGVIALKRIDYLFNKRRNKAISLFAVSSDFEKGIIHNNFGFDESEIMVTGLTRWDVLRDKSQTGPKKIFVMPTWRSWMDGIPEKEFIESNYFKHYKELLESKKLNNILEKNNITLHFMLHPKFSAYSDKFAIHGDQIYTHQFGEVKINEMLMESSLLVTDYSSVSFEFFYMKKPVVFFQFDRDDYERYQGTYMDFDKDLFGDSVANVGELLGSIQYYINNDFKEKSKYSPLRKKFFKYVDHNNSKRTFEAVREFERKLK